MWETGTCKGELRPGDAAARCKAMDVHELEDIAARVNVSEPIDTEACIHTLTASNAATSKGLGVFQYSLEDRASSATNVKKRNDAALYISCDVAMPELKPCRM